jgi:hypothetical protein
MRWLSLLLVGFISCTVAVAAEKSAGAPSDSVGLRIRFGMKDKEGVDWSGKLELSSGKVTSIRGWRWAAGDSAEGDSWTVATRRAPVQSAADKARVQATGKMPVTDNGIIVTLSDAAPDADVTFDAKTGKVNFKLSDLPYGKPLLAMEGNVQVERVPAVSELASTVEDEDYPAAVMAKDGTLYVAYLSFAHGKDFQGARERPATPESGPVSGPLAAGAVKRIEKPEDLDYLAQPAGGEQIYLRIRGKDGTWGKPVAVTDGKHELYRPAIAVDGGGRVWVFYSAHLDADKNLDYGNWEMLARSFAADGSDARDAVNISKTAGADFMPAAATDSNGKVFVTWVGGREKNFNVFVSHQDGRAFSKPERVSQAEGNEWEPAIAADAKGNVTVAWDTYEKGDYDVYIARLTSDGTLQKPQAVAATLAFEVRPSLAYDAQGKLWIAWEESGDQWGKDFGALKKKGIPLYQSGRSVNARVLGEDGKWFQPPDVMEAMPINAGAIKIREGRKARGVRPAGVAGSIAPCFPRIATGADGNVWLTFRGKPGGGWRTPVGSVWFEYVTRLGSDGWNEATWLPRSNDILDNRPAVVANGDQLTVVFSGDGRGEANPAKLGDPHLQGTADGDDAMEAAKTSDDAAAVAPTTKEADGELLKNEGKGRRGRGGGRAGGAANINADLFVTSLKSADFASASAPAALAATQPAAPAAASSDTNAEREAIDTMHKFRVDLNGESLRIWRGEFHRHTEFSFDGGNDGGLLDMWRYGIDAADLDWIGDGDHDYGTGREYSWWTTQKAVTLFTLPNRFVPMYSYERSVGYPEGHRNCMFAKRGVRSLPRLPMSSPDKFAPAPDTNLLYMYLKRFDGLCAPHTSATNMGTDWRNYDPEVEPFVEIYQGDRNNYERPDAPRSAVTEAKLKQSTPEKESLCGWQPKGFVNLALKMGRRYAFEASSDHISTHLSYCNVFVTEPTREAILDAVKKKRVYGATDNIIADVRCKVDDKEKFMGEEFTIHEPPTLKIHIVGAQKIAKVTIIKDDEEVHVVQPNQQDVTLSWTDPKPTAGKTSYYYVRGEQVPDVEGASSGELVWASPMWIKYEAK